MGCGLCHHHDFGLLKLWAESKSLWKSMTIPSERGFFTQLNQLHGVPENSPFSFLAYKPS
jgi:hypothetical protein